MKKRTDRLATFGVILALTVLLGNAWVSYRSTKKIIENEGWVEHTLRVRGTIGDVQASMSDAVAAQRGYLLIGQVRFLDPYEVARTAIAGHLSDLAKLTEDNAAQQQRLTALRNAI